MKTLVINYDAKKLKKNRSQFYKFEILRSI